MLNYLKQMRVFVVVKLEHAVIKLKVKHMRIYQEMLSLLKLKWLKEQVSKKQKIKLKLKKLINLQTQLLIYFNWQQEFMQSSKVQLLEQKQILFDAQALHQQFFVINGLQVLLYD
ncbi:unnamed protein product [Paramecium sonneborni]|uniref:Uncharacterized protein n=1 Tax=Paramecium sonneborni TaxID=65129 RepID=A0A8S1RTZ6_9CILI|nr:unnamed protein product [Paramecium sonneborni]